MESYFAPVHGLAREVTHAVAVALELPEDYFDAWFTTPMVIMSPLHYPPQAAPTAGRSARPHRRRRPLRIRLPGPAGPGHRGGLQVRNAAGQWIDPKPVRGTFVIRLVNAEQQTT